MLKAGCMWLNLALTYLHKSETFKFRPFTKTDKDLMQELWEKLVDGPAVVFTRKSVVIDIFLQNSTNLLKSIVGIDASQLWP